MYTQVFLRIQFLALYFSPCILSLCLPLLTHTIIHHSFADDLQLQMSAPPDRISELLNSIQTYIGDVKAWASANMLVRLFADDCLLYRPIHSQHDQIHSQHDQLLLQQDLAALETWAEDWGMRFNVSKCYLMSIHRSKHPYCSHYKLYNHILEQVEENTYYGVTIHKGLKWASHINKFLT